MDALAGSFQLTAFDRPGYGFSGETGKYSLEENADMALKLIDALKLENVVVVGHTAGPASRN
jgi:pimeloyl-ACP methyl ester carboxylesterase